MESAPSVPVAVAPTAPPVAPASVSALDAAIEKRDVGAALDARAAVRAGKPLPTVAAGPAPVADPATPPDALGRQAKGPKPKDLDADERLRSRVADAVSPLQKEIADLKAQLAGTSRAPAKPAEPPAPSEPAYKRYATLPDAPKLAAFDSVEEHTAAMAHFVASKLFEEHRETAGRSERDKAAYDADVQRVDRFAKRFDAAKTADPTFLADLTDDEKVLLRKVTTPRGALPRNAQGEPIGSGPEHYLSEFVYDSDLSAQVLTHFRQHPEDVARLTTPPAAIGAPPAQTDPNAYRAWVFAFQRYIEQEFYRLEGRLASGGAPPAHSPAATVAAAPSTVSSAPPPAPTLTRVSTTSDPETAAVRTGNAGDFLKIRAAKRVSRAQG